MRKYIYLMLLSGMMACQEDDLVQYTQERDALQFSGKNGSKSFNFATAYETGANGAHYFGDSLAETKMEVVLQLQGFPTPDERPYKLKAVVVEGQDTSKKAEVRFEPYYSLAPNQLLDTIEFTVLRPKARGNYTIGIAVDTDGDDAFFEKGAEESAVYELKIADRYDEPADWQYRKEWLGEFDPEKYAFMVTTTNVLFSRSNSLVWDNTDRYNATLRFNLENFNASVPEEERKQFTFPNMPKWTWWDKVTNWLGEFSIEKYTFMQQMREALEHDVFKNDSKLEWWNLKFRELLKEEPREGIEFPENQDRSSWWRESILGDWTIEKQEFVVKELFPRSNYKIGETTYDYAASVLRRCVDKYNLANPDSPLDYTFADENEPDWWEGVAQLFGSYSLAKRDIVVEVVFERNKSIDWLMTGDIPSLYYIRQAILTRAEEYNATHPDQRITDFPEKPEWNTKFLGEYSQKKYDFVIRIMGTYTTALSISTELNQWNAIFRYEAKRTGDSELVFPELDESIVKPSYWDTYKYLGKYSESKLVFTWMMLLEKLKGTYMPLDEEILKGNYWEFQWNSSNVYTYLTTSYSSNYATFMTNYAASAEEFSYPDEFLGIN